MESRPKMPLPCVAKPRIRIPKPEPPLESLLLNTCLRYDTWEASRLSEGRTPAACVRVLMISIAVQPTAQPWPSSIAWPRARTLVDKEVSMASAGAVMHRIGGTAVSRCNSRISMPGAIRGFHSRTGRTHPRPKIPGVHVARHEDDLVRDLCPVQISDHVVRKLVRVVGRLRTHDHPVTSTRCHCTEGLLGHGPPLTCGSLDSIRGSACASAGRRPRS